MSVCEEMFGCVNRLRQWANFDSIWHVEFGIQFGIKSTCISKPFSLFQSSFLGLLQLQKPHRLKMI